MDPVALSLLKRGRFTHTGCVHYFLCGEAIIKLTCTSPDQAIVYTDPKSHPRTRLTKAIMPKPIPLRAALRIKMQFVVHNHRVPNRGHSKRIVLQTLSLVACWEGLVQLPVEGHDLTVFDLGFRRAQDPRRSEQVERAELIWRG